MVPSSSSNACRAFELRTKWFCHGALFALPPFCAFFFAPARPLGFFPFFPILVAAAGWREMLYTLPPVKEMHNACNAIGQHTTPKSDCGQDGKGDGDGNGEQRTGVAWVFAMTCAFRLSICEPCSGVTVRAPVRNPTPPPAASAEPQHLLAADHHRQSPLSVLHSL